MTDVNAYHIEKGYIPPKSFTLLPKRWIVERTFAWIGRYRRMSKDYEFLTSTQKVLVKLAMTNTVLKRLL